MAAAETARLIAELSLKDKLTPGAKTATASVSKLESSLGKMSASAKRGASNAGKALLGLGAVAAVGIGAGVKSGLENLATLESSVSAVDGAIKQMGYTGQITGAQVATMANEIESSIGAAFDDKDIVQATSTLLRFGKVTPANLRPAMVVMTDLATKTGSVDSAATLLAKALADPTKAAGKLARAGVVLTKSQQDQIKAYMKAGKAGKAQKVILDALSDSTKGAAEASQGPYKRALSTLADVTEDAQKALATGFLPVIERVAKWLSTSLADPKVMDDIRGLGDTLAGVFDQGVSFVQKIPWGTVRDAMKTVGDAAKMALDAFTSMPAWVQTAVISGWGLNKLTGGALGEITKDLASGLIKGVLGINAGVVNVNGGVVKGPGGPGIGTGNGSGSGSGSGGGGGGGVSGLLRTVPLVGVTVANINDLKPDPAWMTAVLRRFDRGNNTPGTIANDPTGFKNSGPAQSILKTLGDTHSEQIATTSAVTGVATKQDEALIAFRSGERTTSTGLTAAATAARNAGVQSATAAVLGAARVAGAVAANRPVVTTNVQVNVTANSVTKAVSVSARYGQGSSRDRNSGHGP